MTLDLSAVRDREAVRKAVFVIAIGAALLHLYYPLFGVLKEGRVLHLMIFLSVVFLLNPIRSQNRTLNALGHLFDIALIAGTLIFSIYPLLGFDDFIRRAESINDADMIIGCLAVAVVLEGVRRAAGLPMVMLAVVLLLYAYYGPLAPDIIAHKGAAVVDIINIVYVAPEGLYGLPVAVMTTYVFLFILFGTVLEASGGSAHIMHVANALVGRRRGGPAKIAVIASGMMGSISGSAVANVATTGAVTIPMMKRIGMRPEIAAGIEAVASTGGMIMPPVMGAVAFIMSEMVGMPYIKIIVVAAIPAILYYFTLFIVVHLESGKLPSPETTMADDGPSLVQALKSGWWVGFPIAILVGLLVAQYSAPRAIVIAILFMFVATFIKHGIKGGIEKTLVAFDLAVRATAPLTVLCAAAGIVISMVYLTGIGVRFSSIVLTLSQGHVIGALVLVASVCIVLGMGLPVTAAYLTTVAIAGPVMQDLGFTSYASHLFIIFFAVLSSITPPFCMAAFTAAGVANSRLWPTGWYAFKFGFTGYIIPFMFILTPSLLIVGSTPGNILYAATSACAGLAVLAVAVVGFLHQRLSPWERVAFGMAGGLILLSSPWLKAAGLSLAVAAYLFHRRSGRSAQLQAQGVGHEEA